MNPLFDNMLDYFGDDTESRLEIEALLTSKVDPLTLLRWSDICSQCTMSEKAELLRKLLHTYIYAQAQKAERAAQKAEREAQREAQKASHLKLKKDLKYWTDLSKGRKPKQKQ